MNLLKSLTAILQIFSQDHIKREIRWKNIEIVLQKQGGKQKKNGKSQRKNNDRSQGESNQNFKMKKERGACHHCSLFSLQRCFPRHLLYYTSKFTIRIEKTHVILDLIRSCKHSRHCNLDLNQMFVPLLNNSGNPGHWNVRLISYFVLQ